MDYRKLIEKEAAKEIAAIEAMEAKLGKEAVKLQSELYRLLVDKYLDALQTDEAGNVLYNSKNLGYVNDLNKTWQTFQEKHYLPVINDFAKDLLSIVDIEAAYFTAIGSQFDLNLSMGNTLELLQQQLGINLKKGTLIEGSYLDRLFQGEEVKAKVADYVMANVSTKTGFKELKSGLDELVNGSAEVDGAMTQYLRTYAYDTFSHVQGAIDNQIADTYGFNSFIYQGDVIATTREFCAERAGGVYNRDDIAEWEGMDWAGKDWTLPFEQSKGGYNCRHNLRWIPDEAVDYFKETE